MCHNWNCMFCLAIDSWNDLKTSLKLCCNFWITTPPPFPCTATAKSLQSCPTLCDPVDGSPPGSPVPGILQARTLEWVAISLSDAWKWKVKVKSLSHVRLFATPWTAAHQAPPSMGFSRQEYWSGVPLPSLFFHETPIFIWKNDWLTRVIGIWVYSRPFLTQEQDEFITSRKAVDST